MAAVLNLDMGCVARLEQYEDDSVEAWFTDGTKICLTACGNAFTRQEKTKTGPDPFGHLPHGPTATVHQFTAYASKECRERVYALLEFRNLFAEQPFLPATLLSKEIKVSEHAILDYGVWPSKLQQAVRCNLLKTGSTGETRLQACDGCAWAELAPHGQTLTICYLARVSHGDKLGCSTAGDTHTLESCSAKSELQKARHQYVWRREIHSVARTPDNWAHPLSLLLQHRSHDHHMTTATPDKENERQDAVVSTPLTPTLPLSCLHPHLHHHTQHQTWRVKVLFTEGVFYRVFIDGHQQPFVEALPNQITALRSHDSDGRFFRCWSADSGRVQESMYCVDHTPLLPSGLHPFSVARVIGQASRLLDRVLKLGGSKVTLCWKTPSPPPSPPSSPLHYSVPGLGRFTVRANGHVRCVFTDRTTVDFFNTFQRPSSDLTQEVDRSDLVSGGSVVNSRSPPGVGRGRGRGRGVEVARGVWVDHNWCRLLQPNGRYLVLSAHHPTSHHRYIEVVREWCEWLSRPEDSRGQFYQRTIYDHQTQREVLAELSKIERFNAITTNSCSSQWWEIGGCGQLIDGRGQSIGGCGQPGVPSFVADALKRTETIVQDIDTILGK